MLSDLHTCPKGRLDLGYSSFAKGLQANDVWPDHLEREQIAEKLLAELAGDGVLPLIWAHAGHAAFTGIACAPEDP